MTAASPVAQRPTQVVLRWFAAWQEHDLEGMLATLDPDVHFHPLRLGGLAGSYEGHDGVRDWFARLTLSHLGQRVTLQQVRDLGGGRVFASGALSLHGEADLGPFCAFNRFDGGLIVAAHHYLTDPHMIEYLGLLP